MKFVFSFLTASIVAGVVAGPAFAEFKKIKTEAQFQKQVVGAKISNNGTWLVLSNDGKLTGKTAKGDKMNGVWKWNQGFFCRNLLIGKKELGSDCQVVAIDGNEVQFTREQGKGDAIVFTK